MERGTSEIFFFVLFQNKPLDHIPVCCSPAFNVQFHYVLHAIDKPPRCRLWQEHWCLIIFNNPVSCPLWTHNQKQMANEHLRVRAKTQEPHCGESLGRCKRALPSALHPPLTSSCNFLPFHHLNIFRCASEEIALQLRTKMKQHSY